MAGDRPSVVRATLPYAVLAWTASAAIAAIAGLEPWGLFTASLPIVLFWGPQAVGAYRVRAAMERFATAVPGRPEATTSVWGPMQLAWPALDLEVEGRRWSFRINRLIIRIGEETYAAGGEGASELGRRAAQHAQAGTSPGQIL